MVPRELRLGRRRVGGLLARQVQLRTGPRRRGDLVHSAHAYAAATRADVVTLHDCFPETLRDELGRTALEHKLWLRSLRGLTRRGAHILTPTQHVRSTFLGLHPEVPGDRVHVTPLGLSDAFQPAPASAPRHPAYRDGALNILVVADLNPRKRLDWLLLAAAALPHVRIVHAGPQDLHRPAWAQQAEQERVAAAALGDRLVRLGRVGFPELVRLYQGADLLVHPTLDEGFGFPPLEALACATPALVPDLPVLRETLGEQGHYFAGPDGLASALAAWSRGRDRPERSFAVSQAVRRRFTWHATALATKAIYDRVRSERSRR